MSGGKVIEKKWLNTGSDDPFDQQVLFVAATMVEFVDEFTEAGGGRDAALSGAVAACCKMADVWESKEPLAQIFDGYVVDLRSGFPVFDEKGSRA